MSVPCVLACVQWHPHPDRDSVDAPELDALRVPPQTYAVFTHDGHVSEIRRTWKAIFGTWSQEVDYKLVDAPQFERYGENFDPQTGNGNIEIWIPIR